VSNNDSQPVGPILGKLVEPAYQQGSNPTGPVFRIRTWLGRYLKWFNHLFYNRKVTSLTCNI